MENIIQAITDAKQQRAKVLKDQSDILAQARAEKREFNSDEEAKYNAAEADYVRLDDEVRRLEQLRDREERMAIEQHEQRQAPDARHEDGQAQDPEKRYAKVFGKYLRYGLQGLTKEEKDVVQQRYFAGDKEQRAQTVTTTGGGYAIPTGFANRVEQLLKYYGPMLDPNVCGSLNTASGNTLNYPTLDGTSTKGRKLTINTQVTTTDLTFGQVTFDAYKYSSDAILVPVELLEDEQVDLEMVVGEQIAERLGRIANQELTVGDGSGDPNGIVTASSAGKTAAGTTAFTRDEILDLLHSVDRAYRMNPKAAFMMNDSVLLAIKKMTLGSGDDRPLWQPSIRESEPDRLEGYRYWVNNDMASTIEASAKVMLFGDFSKYLVRRVSQMRMLRLTERYADYDQVGFFGFMRLDGDIIASGSIKHLVMAS